MRFLKRHSAHDFPQSRAKTDQSKNCDRHHDLIKRVSLVGFHLFNLPERRGENQIETRASNPRIKKVKIAFSDARWGGSVLNRQDAMTPRRRWNAVARVGRDTHSPSTRTTGRPAKNYRWASTSCRCTGKSVFGISTAE